MMNRVTKLAKLRKLGVFRDYTWPAELPEFGRYNVVYGWNGTGKTTISKLFRALETRVPPVSGEVTLSINGATVAGHDFPEATLPIRVFNRDFVAESVFPVGGADVPPILVVGKESVEKQKEVEQLKLGLASAQTEADSTRSRKREAERVLDQHCIDRAGLIKDTLRSSGVNPYNNYDKSNYRERIEKMAGDGDADAHKLSDLDLERLRVQHRASPKPKVREISHDPVNLEMLGKTASQLLKTTVISAAIEALKVDPPLSSWVHEGLRLHRSRNSQVCLFCEQTLPENRLTQLEAHFNTEYEQFLASLDAQIAVLAAGSNALDELVLANRAELYDDLAAEYEAAATTLQEARASISRFLASLKEALIDKKRRAFEILELDFEVPADASLPVEQVNGILRKHNEACDLFQTRVNNARKQIEADIVAAGFEQFLKLNSAVDGSEAALSDARAEAERLNSAIARLESEIVEHRQPAEDLNEDLRKYLGHHDLQLEIKDTGYTITRSGAPALALSEGEITAIALLYFLKSLEDRRFELADGVVVLDDPVSSLDANALYLAFGFIRARTQHAAQLFILTHNFTLFRQVRNWFHNLKGQRKKDVSQRPARFYMLDCIRSDDQRCSSIQPLDPLLEHYDSEYHYLFARIYREASASPSVALEQSYIFPNMARRLLEAFLAFRHPQGSHELWQKLRDVEFDEAKKLRILRFVHTHSHSGDIGEPEHDPALLGEARAVLIDLLELINGQDSGHFAAMVEVIERPENDDDE